MTFVHPRTEVRTIEKNAICNNTLFREIPISF